MHFFWELPIMQCAGIRSTCLTAHLYTTALRWNIKQCQRSTSSAKEFHFKKMFLRVSEDLIQYVCDFHSVFWISRLVPIHFTYQRGPTLSAKHLLHESKEVRQAGRWVADGANKPENAHIGPFPASASASGYYITPFAWKIILIIE